MGLFPTLSLGIHSRDGEQSIENHGHIVCHLLIFFWFTTRERDRYRTTQTALYGAGLRSRSTTVGLNPNRAHDKREGLTAGGQGRSNLRKMESTRDGTKGV